MTQVELAKLIGITDRQVRKLVALGMPMDSLEAAQSWRRARKGLNCSKGYRVDGNPGTKRNKEPERPEHEEESGTDEEQSIDLEVTDADELFRRSRAVKEKSLALQAKAEHEAFIGTLVKREDVERGVSAIMRQARDSLVNLGRRIAPEIAGLSDVLACERVIDREHRALLDALSRGFAEKFK